MNSSLPLGVVLESVGCPNGCPACDEFVLEGCDRLHEIEGSFKVMKCLHCGLMRTDPRPTAETIGIYYPSNYGPYQDTEVKAGPNSLTIKSQIKEFLGFKSKSIPRIGVGKLLEIGCANGIYMDKMRNAGWIVEGIEFSESVATQARAKGFKVQTATVETAQPPTEQVDIIAAWMVLEHLHEPVKALEKMRSWIKPDGYLIASVPDADSWERRIFKDRWYALQLPTHLYHYTPDSISYVLRCAGWKLNRIRWQRNCNNLLRSLELTAEDKQLKLVKLIVSTVRTSPKAMPIRLLLSWVLGVTRMSGRMEIWAQPIEYTIRK